MWCPCPTCVHIVYIRGQQLGLVARSMRFPDAAAYDANKISVLEHFNVDASYCTKVIDANMVVGTGQQ